MDLNPAFNFECYVVGQPNQSAVAAARAVAEAPGLAYNPLVIFGPSGQGKTHLLMALAQLARQHMPSLAVRYMTLAEFAEAFETAVAAGQHAAFTRRLSELDMLLLDDVQALSGQDGIQDELCRLQDSMWRAGKQLVITCDRPPEELTAVDERLVARLGSGLAVDVAPPDAAMRRAILQRCADTLEVGFDDGVLDAVGEQPVRSVRDLLGGLARLVALDAAAGSPVTPSDATTVFGGAPPPDGRHSPPPALAPPDAAAQPMGEFEDFIACVTLKIAESARMWRSQAQRGGTDVPDKIRSREKMIWAWPVADARLIEELF